MHFRKIAALSAGVFLTGNFALAQPPQVAEPILFQNFETSKGEWAGIGGGAKVELAKEAENVKTGQSALRFDYTVQAGQFEALASPLATATFASLASIKFWIKSSHDTTMLLALQEQGGGRFATVFHLAKNEWQAVEVDPAEMVLQVGNDDPKDSDGKLDLEKLEYVGLIDFDQVLIQMISNAPQPVAQMLQIEDGPRTFYLDDMTLSGKALPKIEADPDTTNIDLFQRPQAEWAGIGGVKLERLQAKDSKDNALKVTYPQQPGRLMALLKPLKMGALKDKKQLSFQAASMKASTLLLQLEEASGGKYNATIQVPGNASPTPIKINFADFKVSEDSNDTNDRLDLDQVKQLLMLDLSGVMGMMGGAPGVIPGEIIPGMEGAQMANENTLWLNAMRAK